MKNFLIIGGTTKAGTSALFNYLAQNPNFCPSNIKETRFFLESDYPVKARSVLDTSDFNNYYKFFNCNDDRKIFLEATPDYLYSQQAITGIKNLVERNHNVKLLFILRNPVERFISWFYFGKLLNDISEKMSFREFYEQNLLDIKDNNALTALKKGLYSHYLADYLNFFDKKDIILIPYSEFKNKPIEVLNEIYKELNLPEVSAEQISLSLSNETYHVKNRFLFECLQKLRRYKARLNSPLINRTIKKLQFVVKLIVKVNSGEVDKSLIDSSTLEEVKKYYEGELHNLSTCFKIDFNW